MSHPPEDSGVAVVPLFGGSRHPCSETRFGFLARLLDAQPGDVKGGREEQGITLLRRAVEAGGGLSFKPGSNGDGSYSFRTTCR
jgi:hypothetical protein